MVFELVVVFAEHLGVAVDELLHLVRGDLRVEAPPTEMKPLASSPAPCSSTVASWAVSVEMRPGVAELARGADELRRVGGRHAGEHEQVGLGLDDRQQHRGEVGGVDLVGHVRGHHFEPERLGGFDAAVTLAERVGLVGRDEGDLLYAIVFHQVLVDRGTGLVVRDHPEHGVRGRGRRRAPWGRSRGSR